MNRTLKIGEFFSGYGSQHEGLNNLGIPFEVVVTSDIDDDANRCYSLLHGETNNLGDITKIDPKTLPHMDFMSYTAPCTDVSNIGEGKGIAKGSGTRSALLWTCEDIIREKRPSFLMMENVLGLLNRQHRVHLMEWINVLQNMGYESHLGTVNAKDHQLPHNRDRVFLISIHRREEDTSFSFPQAKPLKTCIEDYLEGVYSDHNSILNLPQEQVMEMYENEIMEQTNSIKVLGMRNGGKHSNDRIVSKKGIAPCFTHGGDPKAIIDTTLDGKIVARRLTPYEELRLMGFSKQRARLVEKNFSKTAVHRMCGNSIAINVLEGIFEELFLRRGRKKQGRLF